ncbi:FtsQ-type POTRA domain-containing protein [Luethyella okanaganae]|uniref:FtsQ-type POTRA domain-containing protein n=1 Tax=Luethyella okanaganae TaxID=69372 RepID=A0ABW1VGP7_9MICO
MPRARRERAGKKGQEVDTETLSIIHPSEVADTARITPLTARIEDGSGDGLPSGYSSDDPSRPLSARAQWRAAKRARRSYERAEVRRFTRHSRRRRLNWIIAVAAVAALMLFVVVGAFSPLMALRTIQVEGAARVNPADVVAVLDDQLGTPLPLVDFGRVRSDLSRFILIRSYSTESRPPGTLVVRIVERDPVGVIRAQTGFDLVDPAGVVVQTTQERPEGYPMLEVQGAAGLAAAGAVVQALPADIRTQLDTVRAATKDDVSFVLAGGANVVWGSAEQSAMKAIVLSKLMAVAPSSEVSAYDVSSPNSPVYR